MSIEAERQLPFWRISFARLGPCILSGKKIEVLLSKQDLGSYQQELSSLLDLKQELALLESQRSEVLQQINFIERFSKVERAFQLLADSEQECLEDSKRKSLFLIGQVSQIFSKNIFPSQETHPSISQSIP